VRIVSTYKHVFMSYLVLCETLNRSFVLYSCVVVNHYPICYFQLVSDLVWRAN